MSLRAFHMFFIAVSIVFGLWFALWCWDDYRASGEWATLVYGALSFVGGAGLVFYLNWFVKKSRRWGVAAATLLLGLSVSPPAHACAVCFGDKDSAMVQGANAGILFLLVVIVGILAAVAGFAVVFLRRARRLGH